MACRATQRDAIAAWLRKHGRITPMDALRILGSYRLAARIHELRRDGMKIRTDYFKCGTREQTVYKLVN